MRVIIAGGGIAGLATALSLADAGITDLVIAEAVEEIRPLGVGINLLPHAVRELTELGLADALEARAVACAELAYYNRHGQRIWTEPRGLGAGYKWPQYSVHRGELQQLLLRAVHERLGPDAVRTGHTLTAVERDGTGIFDTQGGPVRLTGDVLIAADGIRSTVRALRHPDEGPPPWNGLVLWRGTSYAPAFLTGRSMIMAGDGVEKFVAYPIREGEPALVNWIAERPRDSPPAGARGDWSRPVDRAEVLRHFGDWTFDWLDIPGLIASAHTVYEYPMVDRDPLPTWNDGRVTLVGDAAHAMYPIGSNGASQAIIDARVLAYELATAPTVDDALTRYDERRRPPTTALCLANRQLGPEVVMRLAHERAPDGFTDIETVIPRAELAGIADGYKRTAGFDPALLNERESFGVPRR
jgi:2-polyprenyl-6-methoxyphenol hydroxylase-like FAD-dependent oxidoreductase